MSPQSSPSTEKHPASGASSQPSDAPERQPAHGKDKPVQSPLRVLYLVSLFPCWSETFIVREIHALARQGVDIRIVSLKPHSEPMVQPDAQVLLDRVIYPPSSLAGSLRAALPQVLKHPVKSVAELWPLVRSLWRRPTELAKSVISWWRTLAVMAEVQRFAPQHLHAHWATYPSTAARILAGRIGCPWSFTGHAHDIFVHDQNLSGKLAQADFSVTISEYNRRQLSARLPSKLHNRLAVIHCGVLPADLPFTAEGREPAYIVGVGRLDPIKGFIHLVKACALLQERGIDFRCDIIGDGPLRDELQQAINQAGLSERVRLTGALPQQDVRQKINRATMFVLPSVLLADGNADGIPVALMEAMACGATAISTQVSGIPELIHHEENGLLVTPGQATELADAMARLLADAPLRTRLAQAARNTIIHDFDADIEAAKLLGRIQAVQPDTGRWQGGNPASRPLRVMLMTDEMEVGGSQRQIVQLAMGLKERGIECVVLYFIKPSFLVDRLHAAGIQTLRVDKRRRVDPEFVWKLRQTIRQWAPDVLHCYSFTAELWGAIATRLLPASERPTLITSVRGTYEWYSANQWRMKHWASQRSQGIISNSREGAEYAARQMGLPMSRFSIVHNGVEVPEPAADAVAALRKEYTAAAPNGQAAAPFETLLLFVGRLVEHKNLPRLLDAFARVAAERPHVRLLLVGGGPLHDTLAARIRELKLDDRALLLGERPDVAALMKAADLLVAPSLREGMSNVILEAMALGLPVLATRVGGTPEVIEDGLHGVLVDPIDTQALADAMLQLIDDPVRRQAIGQAGRQKVLEQYSPRAMVSAMLKEYSRVSQR